MKMPKSLVIASLTTLVGASLAGTITSTLAWFQYATSAQVAYTGTTSHCTKLLKISSDNGASWKSDIVLSDSNFAPITTGATAKNAALPANFYVQPNPKQGAYSNWSTASDEVYAQYTILVKVNDVSETSPQLQNDVYLTDVTIMDATASLDLSDAIRVHVSTTYGSNQHKNFLFAKSVEQTAVGGYLDLDNDGAYETTGYAWSDEKIIYGDATDNGDGTCTPAYQTSYLADDSTIIAGLTEKGDIDTSTGTSIGTTSATNGEYLEVTVTIWLEGWAILQHGAVGNAQGENKQVWNSARYTSKDFHVGLTFGVKLHSDADHPANP